MDQDLDLRAILHTLRTRIWLILGLPVGAALLAALISLYVLHPVYSASATIWVVKDGAGQINYNDLMLNRNLTKTYAEVATSRAVLGDALQRLQLPDLSLAQLQSHITVTPVRDTEIIQFAVQDGSPVRAAQLAGAVAEAFKAQIHSFMKVENVAIVDAALVPTAPVKPRPLMNTAIAAVLGAMAAVGLAFLLDYMDTSVKTPADVSARLGLTVVGIIPVIEVDHKPEAASRRDRSRAQLPSGKTKMVVEK